MIVICKNRKKTQLYFCCFLENLSQHGQPVKHGQCGKGNQKSESNQRTDNLQKFFHQQGIASHGRRTRPATRATEGGNRNTRLTPMLEISPMYIGLSITLIFCSFTSSGALIHFLHVKFLQPFSRKATPWIPFLSRSASSFFPCSPSRSSIVLFPNYICLLLSIIFDTLFYEYVIPIILF